MRAAGVPGLVSGLMWAIMFTAFLFALSLTTTANALVVMSVSPLLTVLFAKMFLNDPVPLRTWLAAGAAAVGIAWMFSGGTVGALRRDGDRVPDPGRGGDQRGRPARERGEARPRARRDARRRALLPDRPSLRFTLVRNGKRCRSARVSRHHPARAAVHAAGAREPRAARAGDRAARTAGGGARTAVGVAGRGRGTRRGRRWSAVRSCLPRWPPTSWRRCACGLRLPRPPPGSRPASSRPGGRRCTRARASPRRPRAGCGPAACSCTAPRCGGRGNAR